MSNLSPLGKTARIIRSDSPFRPMTPPVRRFPPSLRGRKRPTRIPKKSKSQSRRR